MIRKYMIDKIKSRKVSADIQIMGCLIYHSTSVYVVYEQVVLHENRELVSCKQPMSQEGKIIY